MVSPQKNDRSLRFAEVTALMLVLITLLVTLVRLVNDDSIHMARRVTEMNRSEPTAELARSVRLRD